MGEEGKFYSENMTMVVWNMDDYPIPAATGIDDLVPKEIDVYCKRIKCDVEEELSNKARIYYLPSCTRTYMAAGVNKPAPLDMTSFLVRFAITVSGPYGPLDLVVIAKAKPKGELDRVLKCLQSRGHTILLIDPPTASTGSSFFTVESLLASAHLLRPPPSPSPSRSDLSYAEDPSKIVDFLGKTFPNDILFWAKDSSHNRFEGILILFSDQFRDDAEYTEMLQNLVCGSCCIVSVIPTQDINKPESPEWPGLLIDGGGYWVGDSLACLS